MTEFPIFDGRLEVRAKGAGRVLTASFPYGKTATVQSAGRIRKERFASDSMSWQVREFEKLQGQMAEALASTMDKARREALLDQLDDALEKRNTHLLQGHSFDKPIADMRSGTLRINHTRAAVELEADLPADADMASWVRDAVLGVRGGQLRGLSPGFQVTSKGAQRLVPEDGNPGVMIREILDAVVFEYSLVSRPAYPGTRVDARDDDALLEPAPRRRLWL